MLLFDHSKKLQTDFYFNQYDVDQSDYQRFLACHEHNARAKVKDAGLIYDAILLAQDESIIEPEDAADHPALKTLCQFWTYYRESPDEFDAGFPYIQLFLGNPAYTPLIPDGAVMPFNLENSAIRDDLKMASVIFGNTFLVTYFAKNPFVIHDGDKQSSILYHTVQGQIILREVLAVDDPRVKADILHHHLAIKTIDALKHVPKRFPELWSKLKKTTSGGTKQ